VVAQATVDEIGRARPQAAQTLDSSSLTWYCVVAIAPEDDTFMGLPLRQNSVIFGVPFLRAFYTVYRQEGGSASMGFATAA
jgi:hypothetical protein